MNDLAPGSRKRDVVCVAIGVTVTAVIAVALTRTTKVSTSRDGSQTSTAKGRASEESRDEPCAAASSSLGGDNAERQLEQARSELQDLRAQRSKLKEDLRAVEKELKKREEPPPYEFDLTQEQWKELASAGRLKYRVPCQMSPSSGWTVGEPVLNALGLSPQDGETLMEAFWRSNKRVWDVVKPLCAEFVPQPEVVELLGFERCLPLVEREVEKEDPLAKFDAHRRVAEARAGMNPSSDEPPSKLYDIYMAVTAEADLFEADLAQSFGPEDAKRIWHEFPCSRTVK